MINNYLAIVLRNFRSNRNYTVINVFGLSIGLTACIVIFLLVSYELSFDKFHSKYNDIYRIVQHSSDGSLESRTAATPYPLTEAFRNDFTDVPLATQVHFQYEVTLTNGEEKQKVKDVLFADSLFFEVFDFEILSGNPKVDLSKPGNVFLTKTLADRTGARVGTLLKIDKVDVQVAGIVADPPSYSHLNFSMIVSMPSFTSDFIGGLEFDQWGMTARSFTYLVLPQSISKLSLERRFPEFIKKYYDAAEAKLKTFLLQPLRDIHFDKSYVKDPGRVPPMEKTNLVFMTMLGAFILLVACINFVNLATVSSEKKSREIGIRKTLGAQQRQLAGFFLSETLLLTLLATLLSLGATEWLLHWLNAFLEKRIELNILSNTTLLIFILVLVIVTTGLAGFYPALILSRYNPSAILRNKFLVSGRSGISLRRGLVIFQFLIAQGLVIGTLIIYHQMEFFRSTPLGFQKDAIVNIRIPHPTTSNRDALRAKLEANPDVQGISFAMGAPVSNMDFYVDFFLTETGEEQGTFGTGIKSVDSHYFDLYDIELIAGRGFNEQDERRSSMTLPDKDQRFVYVINESAVKRLGFEKPDEILGKFITTGFGINAEVVGVVKDFHIASLHKEIVPVVFTTVPFFYYEVAVKLNAARMTETLKAVEKSWAEVYPEGYFEFKFLDDHLASLYKNEEKTYGLFRVFSGVAIFIACLGLYGLIAFVARQKEKEVGIRKVLGASISSILILFSKDFVKLVSVSFLLAAPLVWYTMHLWLDNFAYKIELHWSFFFAGFAATLIIVLLTIAYRSIRTAGLNPSVTLRNE